MARRAFTLIELMLVTLLTAMVVGTLVSLYALAMSRVSHSATLFSVHDQANDLADQIERTVTNSVTCTLVTADGSTGLKCLMPQTGTDSNGDGKVDTYRPYAVSRRGSEKYGSGSRIWFYDSDSTGAFAGSGTMPWKAERTDDSLPTAANVDRSFTYYYGGSKERYNLVTEMSFAVDDSKRTVTFTIEAVSITRKETSDTDGAREAETYTSTVTRSVVWRNWRK